MWKYSAQNLGKSPAQTETTNLFESLEPHQISPLNFILTLQCDWEVMNKQISLRLLGMTGI